MQPHHNLIVSDVKRALDEDIGSGDITASLLSLETNARARIIAREPMLMCGQPWVEEVFHQVDRSIQITWQEQESMWLTDPEILLCYIHGPARAILTAERTALNFLQTLAATATQTHHFLSKLKYSKTRLLDTRKTLPGLRYAQKYAVACAGGVNHRFGLYDAFLIKENHIRAAGSIEKAVAQANLHHPELMVEVEVETIQELKEALLARPDRILLDNFNLDMLKQAVQCNQPKICPLEASGNVDLHNVADIAATGVDYISVGSITKSIRAIDLSLLIDEVYS